MSAVFAANDAALVTGLSAILLGGTYRFAHH